MASFLRNAVRLHASRLSFFPKSRVAKGAVAVSLVTGAGLGYMYYAQRQYVSASSTC